MKLMNHKEKMSQTFVKRKYEVIQHLQENVLPINRALAKTKFPIMIDKITKELKGELVTHTFTRPRDGKTLVSKVVMFPDKSFARRPDVQEMLNAAR
jgi:hypothetical protein